MKSWIVLLLVGCSAGPSQYEGIPERLGRERGRDAPVTECAKAGGILVQLSTPGSPDACLDKKALLYVRYRY